MIVIVTDSTACITKQEARQLGAVYVPMSYTVAGHMYTEKFSGDNGNFASLIASTNDLHTSQPPLGRYEHTFSRLRHAGFEVLCLTISSRLSGTYSNALLCAKGMDGVRVVDTRTTAIGLAFLVREARRMITSEGLGLEETARAIEAMRGNVKTLFSVADMAPLRRSGRLGPVRQSVGTILNLRPLLTCRDGAVVACGTARGKTEAMRSLVDAVPAAAQDLAVQYISEEDAARRVAQQLELKCGTEVTLRKLGPVLGIHLGLSILGAMWFDPQV